MNQQLRYCLAIAIVVSQFPCCDCECCIRSFPDSRFEIAIVYSDFQRVQNFFYRDVPGSVKIAITVSLGVNYFSTSPVLCPDLLPRLGISIVASRLPLWFPYCVSDYCKMVSPSGLWQTWFVAVQLLYRDQKCIAIVVSFPVYRDRAVLRWWLLYRDKTIVIAAGCCNTSSMPWSTFLYGNQAKVREKVKYPWTFLCFNRYQKRGILVNAVES